MKRIYILTAGLLLSGVVNAELGDAGFSGEVSLLTGFSGNKDNLNTENKTKSGTLNSEAESDSKFVIAPLGQLRYTFGQENDQQLFIGTSRNDIIEGVMALELGYAFEFDNESVLSVSTLPTIASGDVFEDPYLVNTKRKTTDLTGNTYRIQYDNIIGSGLNAELAYYTLDVDKERSASTLSADAQKAMQRDGKGIYTSINMRLPIAKTAFIKPSIFYHNFEADGKAVSFDQYGLSMTYIRIVDTHTFALRGEYSAKKFDASNPVFNKTQKDSNFGVNFSYEYADIPGWENWGLNALLGYNKTASNITFYDKHDYIAGVGITYLF